MTYREASSSSLSVTICRFPAEPAKSENISCQAKVRAAFRGTSSRSHSSATERLVELVPRLTIRIRAFFSVFDMSLASYRSGLFDAPVEI